jgi:hypothetical protein
MCYKRKDVSQKKDIRQERPLWLASMASDTGILCLERMSLNDSKHDKPAASITETSLQKLALQIDELECNNRSLYKNNCQLYIFLRRYRKQSKDQHTVYCKQ